LQFIVIWLTHFNNTASLCIWVILSHLTIHYWSLLFILCSLKRSIVVIFVTLIMSLVGEFLQSPLILGRTCKADWPSKTEYYLNKFRCWQKSSLIQWIPPACYSSHDIALFVICTLHTRKTWWVKVERLYVYIYNLLLYVICGTERYKLNIYIFAYVFYNNIVMFFMRVNSCWIFARY